MLATVTAPKKAPKAPAKTPKAPPKRRKSKLTLAGEAAQRGMLLGSLKEHGWSLSRVAESLEMAGPSDVLRSIKGLGLVEEYEAARARGDVRPGPKAE